MNILLNALYYSSLVLAPISFIILVIGLVKPDFVSRLTRKSLSRKQIVLIFGGLTLASVFIYALTFATLLYYGWQAIEEGLKN